MSINYKRKLRSSPKQKKRTKAFGELGFTTAHNYSYEAAEVLAFDPSNVRGMVTINRGQKNGLKNGMAVISDGFLVGRISEVTDNTSKVQLIVDPTSAIPVTLQSADTNGLASGQIGFGLTMDKIPQGEQIKEGDTVITSGLGGEIPKGLILGTVEKITRQENSLFVSAKVRPSANLGSLFRVIVIKG
jgi:rod shape-determining protein MreC